LPTGLLYLLYASKGFGDIWWQSVIEASLAYGQIPFLERLDTLIPIAIILFLTFKYWQWNKRKGVLEDSRVFILIAAAIVGILFSFFKVGKINGHYLIQVYPFILLLCFSWLFQFRFWGHRYTAKIVAILLLLIPMESYLEYHAIGKNYFEKGTFYNGEGIEVPEYLMKSGKNLDNIWFLEFHIGYWVLGKEPISMSTTHPSNLMRSQLFPYFANPRKSSLEELKFILDQKQPHIIVTKGARIPFNADNREEVYEHFENYLSKHYRFIKKIGKATIYQRL